MGSDDGTVYMLRGESADEWVSPAPAREVIVESLVEATALNEDDIGDLGQYVDRDDLAAVVAGDAEEITFAIEGHEVTVSGEGDVRVE